MGDLNEAGAYLLMKRGLYYRPESNGYTGIKDNAGRYTKAEAESHADPVSGVTMVHEADAPEFSPKCYDDLARAHLLKQRDEAASRIAELEAKLATAVEALNKIDVGGPDRVILRSTYEEGFYQGCSWAGRVARQALASIQDSSNDH